MALTSFQKSVRSNFRKKYGRQTVAIIALLCAGKSSRQVANKFGNISVASVAAIKANLTRGTYSNYVYGGGY